MQEFLIAEDETSLLTTVGESGAWVVCQSIGESRMRIFILLEISGAWVVCQSTEELSLVGDKTKVNCYLVDFQALR